MSTTETVARPAESLAGAGAGDNLRRRAVWGALRRHYGGTPSPDVVSDVLDVIDAYDVDHTVERLRIATAERDSAVADAAAVRARMIALGQRMNRALDMARHLQEMHLHPSARRLVRDLLTTLTGRPAA